MPEPAYIRLRYRKAFIPGPITECGENNLWEIHEFTHEISGKEEFDPWALSNWDTKHKVLRVVLEVGAFLPKLYGARIDQGEYLNRVEIFWRQYSEKQKKNHFYFKHSLYPVKITSIKMFMPNVKDPRYERYNHLVAIEFRYRFIEHLYTEGYLHTRAEWRHFFFDESDEPIPEKYLTGRCLSHEALEWEANWRKEQEEAKKRNESLTVTIERLYHDNEPVQQAPFEIELADATIVKGTLDTAGNATVSQLRSTPKRIRFEPDAREFKPVNLVENPEYKTAFAQPDADAIVAEATAKTEQPPEKKGIVLDSIQWVVGTLQGSFKEKQTTSQIIVDAVIGMIPFVGDVTAVRDIIAVTIGLSLEESKRKDKLQWLTLVLLLFALIPVIGGAIKGIGRLLLKAEKQVSHISDFIAVLNRIGVGDSVKFIKNLDLTQYTAVLLGKWRELLQRLDTVITTTKSKIGNFLPKAYIERLEQIRNGLAALKIEGGKMIPESVKELQLKLRTIEDQMYIGEWIEIPKTLKSSTREIEARLVETVKGGKKWFVERMEFPPAKAKDFQPAKGWPNLKEGDFVAKIKLPGGGDLKKFKAIEAFSGPIRAVKLPPGTKIRRVLDASKPTDSFSDGVWWCYELPKDGRAWREDFAVLEDWSKNGVYVEFTVEEPGLYVWEGRAAGQLQNEATKPNFGQYLGGGGTQILVDFKHEVNKRFREKVVRLEKKPTNWGDSHLNVNIPEKEVTVQRLKAQEVAPKGNLVPAGAARTMELTTTQES